MKEHKEFQSNISEHLEQQEIADRIETLDFNTNENLKHEEEKQKQFLEVIKQTRVEVTQLHINSHLEKFLEDIVWWYIRKIEWKVESADLDKFEVDFTVDLKEFIASNPWLLEELEDNHYELFKHLAAEGKQLNSEKVRQLIETKKQTLPVRLLDWLLNTVFKTKIENL